MNCEEIRRAIIESADEKFQKFNSSLIPSIDSKTVIGVKTPQLKTIAKRLSKSAEYEEFLSDLPHRYFEENQIHAFVIAEFKNFDKCIVLLEKFLPYIDNWATCDQLSPKVFCNNKNKLLKSISKWIKSEHTYTVRFAVNMLMKHFLGEEFKVEYAKMVAEIESEDYYVNMVRAWYFATALATNRDEILPYIKEQKLDKWTHNKTIQKAIESYRIDSELKEYVKKLKRKKG